MKKWQTVLENFIEIDGCWVWCGTVTVHGYGQWREQYTHRQAYALLKDALVPGMTLDHLCRNRRCLNPDHLEQVSIATNVMRGDTIAARNSKKTHCKRGHRLSGGNLYLRTKTRAGSRDCKTCKRRAFAAFHERKYAQI